LLEKGRFTPIPRWQPTLLQVRFGRGCDTKLRMYLFCLVLRPGHNPVCDHRYPTKTCDRSNPAVRSSWDNVSSPDPGGRDSREGIPTTASVTAVGGQGRWHG